MHNNVEKKIEFSFPLHLLCYIFYELLSVFRQYWVKFEKNLKLHFALNKGSNLIYQKDPKLIENVIKNGIKIWATLDGTQRLEMFRR